MKLASPAIRTSSLSSAAFLALSASLLASTALGQVRAVGDFKFEFDAPKKAGIVKIDFWDFSGQGLIGMPRLNVPIPYDNTITPDQNLIIKRDAIQAAVRNQFVNYTDALEPIIQAGVRATAFAATNNNANPNFPAGFRTFRGFNMTNVPFNVQRNPANANAVDRIWWAVSMSSGKTGELFDSIINRPPMPVRRLPGDCGHSKVSFSNPNFSAFDADGLPSQWHAGIVVDDVMHGAVVGLTDLPLLPNGSYDTSGAAIAAALYQNLPSSLFTYASVMDPALTGSSLIDFCFDQSGPSITSFGVSFGTTSDSEGVTGWLLVPSPGSLALLGMSAVCFRRRRSQ